MRVKYIKTTISTSEIDVEVEDDADDARIEYLVKTHASMHGYDNKVEKTKDKYIRIEDESLR
jgi:hypothetical protein